VTGIHGAGKLRAQQVIDYFPDQDEAETTIRKQIEQLVQLNEGQAYTYDRVALVKMLDDALATARPQTK
jgi:hypothetical protein